MKSRRPCRAPDPKTCRHLYARLVTRTQEGGDQLDQYFCPDCKREFLIWFWTAGGHTLLSYNFAPVKL